MSGYQITCPDGKVLWQDTEGNRQKIVEELLDIWQVYCFQAWDVDDESSMFTPAMKVKRFQDGLGYYLQIGRSYGVVTDYKSAMNSKREIPVSSCPSDVENLLYGLSSPPGSVQSQKENDTFDQIQNLSPAPRPSDSRHRETRFDRWQQKDRLLHFRQLSRAVVDTENSFSYNGKRYWIDVTEVSQYASTEHGAYGMDYIICGMDAAGDLHFFDQNFFEIAQNFIKEVA